MGFPQTLLELAPFTALESLPKVLAPAADGYRNNLVHGRMPARDLGKAFLDHPIEADTRNRPGRIGQRRQRMNHIAQGRGFDQQYPHLVDLSHDIDQRWAIEALQRSLYGLRLKLSQAVVVAKAAGAVETRTAFQAQANHFNLIGQRRGEAW
ncbi:hypothetical protein D3C72_1495150 [compost metagenome]